MDSARNAHILWATIADRIVTSPLPPYHLAPGVPVSAMIEIGIVVLISATTTFMTVRQSVKRGIGQPGQDPNNPMANSQKYMMYIAPLFALSGLYWQFGLVMYWVTTNLWTLGQQYVLFRNMAPITAGAADAASATAPAAKGSPGPAGTTVSKGATSKSTPARGTAAKPAAKGTAAKSGTASTGAAKAAAAATTAKSGTKVSNGQSSNNGQRSSSQRGSGQRGSGQGGTSQSGRAQRTTTTSRPQTAKSTSSKPAETSDGGERRGLGRLVRSSKPEPEPEPEVPATKLVRQQPVRQSRSKRSGKR